MKTQLSEQAICDIRDIRCRLNVARPGLGTRFINELHETISQLESMPRMGKRVGILADDGNELRCFRVRGFPKFRICYCVESECLRIVRIVHGARDLDNLLREIG